MKLKVGDLVVVIDSPIAMDDCQYVGETGEVFGIFWDDMVYVRMRLHYSLVRNGFISFRMPPEFLYKVGNIND